MDNGLNACDAPTVHEDELQNAAVAAMNTALGNKDDMLNTLEKNITAVLAMKDDNPIEDIDAKLLETQTELLKRANAKLDYDDLADEIARLRELKRTAMTGNAEREGQNSGLPK